MEKKLSYYESAIQYNADLAEFAEQMAPTLQDEEVRRWCLSLAKNFRIHEKRHRKALKTVRARQAAASSVVTAPDTSAELKMVVTATGTVHPAAEANVTDTTEVEPSVVAQDTNVVLPDGCSPFHGPSSPNCEFYPKPEEQ